MATSSSTKKRDPRMYYVNFQGIVQRQDPDQIPEGASPLLINISVDKPGTWSKRKGSLLLGTLYAGGMVQGAIEYLSYSGSRAIHSIVDQNYNIFDPTNNVFNTEETGKFPFSTIVNGVNFLNRVYWVCPIDNAKYESGSTMTVWGAGGSEIHAQNICTAQQTLFVSNVTSVNNVAQSYQDRVYYSTFKNNMPTDQLYNDSETNLVGSTRFFTLLAPVTASYAYGVTGLSYHFTENSCYSFDISYASNSLGIQKQFDEGCCGPRAITTCNSWMVWMDAMARIRGWGGAGPVIPLSWGIEDDSNGEAIINNIDKTQLSNVAAGSFKNKFYFSIGDLTIQNQTFKNVVIVGLMTQGIDNVLYTLYSFPWKPVVFFNAKINSTYGLYCGASDGNVYQLEYPAYNDGGTQPIIAFANTEFKTAGNYFQTNSIVGIYLKYRPQTTQATYLDVSYAVDSNLTYTSLNKNGKINMFDPKAATVKDSLAMVNGPAQRFKSLSLQVGNSLLNQGFSISAIAVKPIKGELDLITKAS